MPTNGHSARGCASAMSALVRYIKPPVVGRPLGLPPCFNFCREQLRKKRPRLRYSVASLPSARRTHIKHHPSHIKNVCETSPYKSKSHAERIAWLQTDGDGLLSRRPAEGDIFIVQRRVSFKFVTGNGTFRCPNN